MQLHLFILFNTANYKLMYLYKVFIDQISNRRNGHKENTTFIFWIRQSMFSYSVANFQSNEQVGITYRSKLCSCAKLSRNWKQEISFYKRRSIIVRDNCSLLQCKQHHLFKVCIEIEREDINYTYKADITIRSCIL